MNLKTMGEVAELLDDMSPFQVGTTGKFKDQSFTLIGRIKVIYDRGTWSEWYAFFNDGREGWLAEAQGNYMMTFAQPDLEFTLPGKLEPLTEVMLNGEPYLIEDARKVVYFASEGELPFPFKPKEKAVSIDLREPSKNSFASITIGTHGKTVYLGEYAPFDSFQFQNMRTIDGW